MAFRASELRLILGIQAYGTTNFARLRRDITALSRAADAANQNQVRVQDQIVQKRQQIATATQRIAALENRIANTRSVSEARAAVQAERFAQRRLQLQQRELQAVETLANRRVQIGRTKDRIATMSDSGMQRFSVQDAQLAQRRVGFQNQINTLQRQGISLDAQSLRNRAAQIAGTRKLMALLQDNEQGFQHVMSLATDSAAFGQLDSRVQEAALRLRAMGKDAERIAAAQSHLPGQIQAVNQQLAVANEQEKLIGMRRYEQAAAIGRQNEYLQVQQGSLQTIEARLAMIKAEEAAITAQEGLTNAERQKQLAALDIEAGKLRREQLLVGELTAEYEHLSTVALERARAADLAASKMQRAQALETGARTAAHVGRTAQFGGLIVTGGFAAAANAAASFNREAALAGTQMRDVGASFQQAALRGSQLEEVILGLMQRFPATAEEMSNSAYEIFSSMNLVRNGVVDTAKGYRLLATANRVAVAGQVDLEEATNAMIVVLNNFDPNLQHVNQTMNQVFSIIRFGQMRVSDFAAAMVPLAPIAKTVGLSLTDVGSALATLTILFKSPQQAAQGLARAIELLNTEPFSKGLHNVGVEVFDAEHRMRPLSKILEDLTKQFPEATTSQKSMVELLTQVSRASGMTKAGIQGTVQARRALAGLVTSMDLYRNILANVSTNQNEFNEAFKAMNATPGVQWQIFTNQIRAFALVVGRAALPFMLQLGDKLVDIAHWIQNLIEKTNGAVVKWTAFAGVIALVGGTLLNMGASIVALLANLRIASAGMVGLEGNATRAGSAVKFLTAGLGVLAGIGIISIPIVMTILKKGDPGLWDFIGGALSGAAGGAMIGGSVGGPLGAAAGAGIGAIAVPIAMEIIPHLKHPDPKSIAPVKAAWQEYLRQGLKAGGRVDMDFDQFQKQFNANIKKFKIPRIGEDVAREGQTAKNKTKSLVQQYQDILKGFTKEWLDAQNDMLNALGADGTDGGGKLDDATKLAKERARLHAQAWKQMKEDVKQASQQLGQVYDNFLNQNKQTFGELGQGPVLTGFLGDIYKNINDLLQQFGQTIPIPIGLINKDLEMQIANFDKLREGYAELLKKGVPPEVVQEIQKMGMAGLPFVQGLVRASGPEFKRFVNNVKTRQKDIEKYTKIDFTNQLNQWKKYGSDIATAIIGGLSSEAAQAMIKGGFDKYVMQIFGKEIKDKMATTIADGLKAYKEQQAAEKAGQKAADAARKKTTQAAINARNRLQKSGKITTTTQKADKAAGAGTGTTAGVTGPSIFAGLNPGFGKAAPRVIINNNGDRTTVHADGVHPKKVKQALNKKGFETRNKRR